MSSELEPIDLANYRLTPFATDQEPESDGAWSPDGKSIAYLKTIGGTPQLMVRALDASAPVQLTRDPGASYAGVLVARIRACCTTFQTTSRELGRSGLGNQPGWRPGDTHFRRGARLG